MYKLLFSFIAFIVSFSALAQDETTLSQINFRGERAYKNGTAFTGILYSDKTANNTCNCTLEANYNDGYLQGTKKEWYSNGKLKFVGNYKKGKLIGTAQRYDSNGTLIKEKSKINEEELLTYFFKEFPPNNYSEKFLKNYLEKFDGTYSNYRNNEFELQRKIKSQESKIKQKVNSVDYSQTFLASGGNISLSKYSFENKSFKILNTHNSNFNKYTSRVRIYDFYSMYNERYSSEVFIKPINIGEFTQFKITPNKAEMLRTNLKSSLIYYSYDYKVLPIRKYDNFNRKSRITDKAHILCYITEMRLYSDKNKKNLIQTIYPKTSYDEIINRYKKDETPKMNLNNSESVISPTILRTKMGSKLTGGRLKYNTIVNGYLDELFRKEFKVSVTNENLKKLGFEQTGTNKFKYKFDYKVYSQKQIYERLIIHKANKLINSSFESTNSNYSNKNRISKSQNNSDSSIANYPSNQQLFGKWKKKHQDTEKSNVTHFEFHSDGRLTFWSDKYPAGSLNWELDHDLLNFKVQGRISAVWKITSFNKDKLILSGTINKDIALTLLKIE